MWKRKFYNGKFQHFYEQAGIACFKDYFGWRFRFINSVQCDKGEFNGYAESLHFWKSLAAVKKHIENNLSSGGEFSMNVEDVDGRKLIEGYRFIDNKFKLQCH